MKNRNLIAKISARKICGMKENIAPLLRFLILPRFPFSSSVLSLLLLFLRALRGESYNTYLPLYFFILSTMQSPNLRRFSSVEAPRWGVRTTRGAERRGEPSGGSLS